MPSTNPELNLRLGFTFESNPNGSKRQALMAAILLILVPLIGFFEVTPQNLSTTDISFKAGPSGAGSTNATILNTTYLSGSHAYNDLYIGCGIVAPCGSIIASGDLILTVNTLTVASGGSIIANDSPPNTQGVGTSVTLSSSWQGNGAGGAGHHSTGGSGGNAGSNGGSSYGVGNETGSNGGSVYDSSGNLVSAAGGGGGRIVIYADSIEIYGTVSASGADADPGYRPNNGSGTGGPGAGGGSGGSIIMRANNVTVGSSSSGSVLATGGDGGDGANGDCLPGTPCVWMYNGGDGGGGGSGGTIDIRASSASNLMIASSAIISTASGSGGSGGAAYGTGSAGTSGFNGGAGNTTTGTWSGWSSGSGTGLTGNEAITASNITHAGALVTGTSLSSTEVYQWSVYTYFPSGSLHDSDTGIWNSPNSSTMTALAAWSPGNFQGTYSVSFRLYEYWNGTLLDTWNSTFYHAGTTNLTADQYEPDDSASAATSIQVNSTTAANIHNAGQDDYFTLNLSSGSMNFVNLSFLHSTADLQLNVYYTNSIGNNILIDYSHSSTHDEQVVFNLTANSTIIIWAFSSGGTSWYNLSVHSTGTPPPPVAVGDVNEPNDSFATATSMTSPSTQSSLTIHNASDDDFFAINATAGTTYWVNITFTHSQGDLDMDFYDSSQSQVDWSAGTGNSESVSYTPTTNQTLYAQVFGWSSATNTYSITFAGVGSSGGGGNGTGTGTEWVTVTSVTATNGAYSWGNLSANSYYEIDWFWTFWNGTAHTIVQQGTHVPSTTSGNTNQAHNAPTVGGEWCFFAQVWEQTTTGWALSDDDGDCMYHEVLYVNHTSDTSGWIRASNLTSGASYTVDWYITDGNITTAYDQGNYTFNSGSTVYNQTINFTNNGGGLPHCILADIWDSSGNLIDEVWECWTTALPFVSIATYTNDVNMTNNSATIEAGDLVPGDTYMWNVSLLNQTYSQIATSNVSNFTATNSSMNLGSWSFSTPTTSGQYCLVPQLWTSNGTSLGSIVTCFTLIYDGDSDSVWDEFDLCPNTPIGSTVDANGCAASERDTDGDGYTDDVDDFVNDSTQWNDFDGDGYGDNASGNNPDAFPQDSTQWADTDGDGCGDNPNGTNGDQFPNDATQCSDIDGDGYGDNPNGTNPDAFPTDPTQWSDNDGDGYGDNPNGNYADDFPMDATQWSDSDGDGYGDNPNGNNPDLWPTDPTQWADTDGDGYGDNPSGTSGDQFPNDASQWSDNDGDGYGDNATGNMPDHFPQDGTQWSDMDGDGCGDNPDGNNADIWPNDPTQCLDTDGDGYGDNASGTNPDAFPNDGTQWADADGDGWGDNPSGNNPDAFPNEYTQQQDTDGDGYGDNPLGVNPDQCPSSPLGAIVDSNGCAASELDDDNDGVSNDLDTCPNTPGGEVADAIGCSDSQKDADMDGVSDALDACPGSPQGEAVDGYGCAASQRDTDNDGIKDNLDDCPATPPGANVNGYGCADTEWDTDDDGIFDADDVCPYTSTSDVADSTGCGAEQRDSDDDGVVDADDICPMTQPGSNADVDGCDSTQRDGDEDGVSDALDTNCPNSPAGETVDSSGCAQSELDDDEDGVTNDLDQCTNTMTTWDAGADGCSPEQVDSDGDNVMDATDVCRNTPEGESVNADGCGPSQLDSDNDGRNDAEDAFPEDPTEWDDTDGDGVGNNVDYYPTDATRSVDEGSISMPFWIALVLVVFIGIGGVAVFFMRRSDSEDEEIAGAFSMETQPAEDLYAMAGVTTIEHTPTEIMQPTANILHVESDSSSQFIPAHATTNEHGQTMWADAAGISWCQDPDGVLRYYDAESGAWVPHQ